MAIILDSSLRSLTVVLTGAKTANNCPFIATYADQLPGASARGQDSFGANDGNTNGVTAVTMVAAPAGGYQRRLKSLNISNQDTAACTYQIGYLDNGTTFILTQITLQTLESLQYEEGLGFWTLDINGAQKNQAAATSSATSTADSKAVSVATAASTNQSSALVVSSANSSAISSNAALNDPSVSSQASSMAALNPASVSSQASVASLSNSTGSSIATSNATSLSTATSSQAASLSTVGSTTLSTGTSTSTATSTTESSRTSAGWSVTISKTKSSFGF